MDYPILFCLWLVQGAIAAYYAKRKGRNPYLWFALGCFFGLFGIFAIFFLKPPKPAVLEKSAAPVRKTLPHRLWYYVNDNTQVGPVSTAALESAWQEGKISLATYVWHEGMENWKSWQQVCNESGVTLEAPA